MEQPDFSDDCAVGVNCLFTEKRLLSVWFSYNCLSRDIYDRGDCLLYYDGKGGLLAKSNVFISVRYCGFTDSICHLSVFSCSQTEEQIVNLSACCFFVVCMIASVFNENTGAITDRYLKNIVYQIQVVFSGKYGQYRKFLV